MTLVGQQTALIKLMANGTLVWAKSYDEPNQGTDFVHTPNGTMVTGLRQYINKKVREAFGLIPAPIQSNVTLCIVRCAPRAASTSQGS